MTNAPGPDLEKLFASVATYAAQRRAGDSERKHSPTADYWQTLGAFRLSKDLPPTPADQVIAELIAKAEPGLMSMTGPRFHGWVIGASHPVGVAADWLTSTWGQNTASHLATPAGAAAERAAGEALLELFDLPRTSAVGFVTGATMANFTGLAAARGEVLRRAGWDVESDGLFGAPPINVVLGDDAHTTVFAALKYLGLGQSRVIRVPTDDEGAMKPGAFAEAVKPLKGPLIAIAQAGQINTGAFDPFPEIAEATKAKGGWLHIDGAFGLWARVAKGRAHLARGLEHADSWAVDGHKWLQTPYDCGYAIVRDQEAVRRAMLIAASYLPASGDGGHSPSDFAPELSRRARGFATWAVLRHLGRDAIAAMVERHCALARRFAERLGNHPGVRVVNDVVLNQVAVRLGADLDPETADRLTRETIAKIQADGTVFVGGAQWRNQWIIRISVIGHGTTEADVDRSVEAILSAWKAIRG